MLVFGKFDNIINSSMVKRSLQKVIRIGVRGNPRGFLINKWRLILADVIYDMICNWSVTTRGARNCKEFNTLHLSNNLIFFHSQSLLTFPVTFPVLCYFLSKNFYPFKNFPSCPPVLPLPFHICFSLIVYSIFSPVIEMKNKFQFYPFRKII